MNFIDKVKESAKKDMASDRFIFVKDREKIMNEIDLLLNKKVGTLTDSSVSDESRITGGDSTTSDLGL